MPVFDLSDEPQIEGAGNYFLPIFAAMLYPRDEAQRERWFAAAMAGSYDWWRKHGASQELLASVRGWLTLLWDFPQAPQRVFRDGMARVPRAKVGGQLLAYQLSLARHHPQHCRVERALALFLEFGPTVKRVSESLATKAWAEFRNVSHLWLAFSAIYRVDQPPSGNSNASSLSLLGLAEGYRQAAESARLLSPSETWKAPEGRGVQAVAVEIPPLDSEKLLFLDTQFPR